MLFYHNIKTAACGLVRSVQQKTKKQKAGIDSCLLSICLLLKINLLLQLAAIPNEKEDAQRNTTFVFIDRAQYVKKSRNEPNFKTTLADVYLFSTAALRIVAIISIQLLLMFIGRLDTTPETASNFNTTLVDVYLTLNSKKKEAMKNFNTTLVDVYHPIHLMLCAALLYFNTTLVDVYQGILCAGMAINVKFQYNSC